MRILPALYYDSLLPLHVLSPPSPISIADSMASGREPFELFVICLCLFQAEQIFLISGPSPSTMPAYRIAGSYTLMVICAISRVQSVSNILKERQPPAEINVCRDSEVFQIAYAERF